MQNIHAKIHTWYQTYGRHTLPWRNTDESYYIYLSEVMLQQTQVKTVLERYYFPFIERFPTLKALGEAKLDEVLKMWEGLGYYNRARNLHSTAALVKELPCEIDALIQLPGIGKNTAHAVAAFAFRQPVPIMEANVKRILCRLYRLETPAEKELWELAYSLVDRKNPFDYNQAMMESVRRSACPKMRSVISVRWSVSVRGKKHPSATPSRKNAPFRHVKSIS